MKFDDAGSHKAYANVCNASSSREEVGLTFGVNNVWQRDAFEVRLTLKSRVYFSPFAAKRLALLLDNVIRQYEARFGTIDVEVLQPASDKAAAK